MWGSRCVASRAPPAATPVATVLVNVRHVVVAIWVVGHIEVAFKPFHAIVLWYYHAIVVEVARNVCKEKL